MQHAESVNAYDYDESLGRDLNLVVVVKGFSQLDIVRKIRERKGSKAFGLTAATIPAERKYSTGAIFLVDLARDSLSEEDIQTSKLQIRCTEPFDVAVCGDRFAYTAGYEIVVRQMSDKTEKILGDTWMSFLHSVVFDSGGSHILTTSAGFDTLLEFEVSTGTVLWEWNAWDHGFNYSERDDLYVTRDPNQTFDASARTVLVSNPEDFPKEGLPTHQSPTRLNGASYDADGTILATCFHRPEVLLIKRDGTFSSIDLGLMHPHGFSKFDSPFHQGYIVTNTGAGQFLLLDHTFAVKSWFDFSTLPSDAEKKSGFGEWLQNVVPLDADRGIFAAVDALRDGIHIVDFGAAKRRFIANPPEWSVQKVLNWEGPEAL
jgi:hypothetical protein